MDSLYETYPCLLECKESIDDACSLLINCYKNGGKVLLCGNGGSASDCDHIVGELMKGFLNSRHINDKRVDDDFNEKLQKGLPAISLVNGPAILSAYDNDCDPAYVYAQMVYGYAKENDVVIGISTSGNSENVCNALRVAKQIGLRTIGLTGKEKSRMSEICDVTIRVPEKETYKVQELHLPVYHYICIKVEEFFFVR